MMWVSMQQPQGIDRLVELQVLRCKNLSLAIHGWRDWCLFRKERKAVCFQAVSRMQRKSSCAAFLAWKDFMPVSRAQKHMLKRCIVRLQHSNLSSAFIIWQSSIPVMRALRSMTAASIARWRSGYALIMVMCQAVCENAYTKQQQLATTSVAVLRQPLLEGPVASRLSLRA